MKQFEISIWISGKLLDIYLFIVSAEKVVENMKNIISEQSEKLTLLDSDLSKKVDEMKKYLTEGNLFY